MMCKVDYLCGSRTYPHTDYYETGARAVRFGVEKLLQGHNSQMLRVGIPMIVPTSAYSTLEDPFKSLIEYAQSLLDGLIVIDFSIFLMQPWLDVQEASSTIIVITKAPQRAWEHAFDLARQLYQMRTELTPEMFTIADVIQRAANNNSKKPVVLIDSADSSYAGASGNDIAVVKKQTGAGVE